MDRKIKKYKFLYPVTYFILFLSAGEFASYYWISSWSFTLSLAYVILSFTGALIISVLIHELGHLLAGLISGYSFVMLRAFHFLWVKTESGVKLTLQAVDGALGQAVMIPPEEDYPPFVLYHSGGILMNLLLGAASVMIVIYSRGYCLTNFFIVTAILNFYLVLTNTLPSGTNDGMNVYRGLTSKNQQKQMKQSLIVSAEVLRGKSLIEISRHIYFDETLPMTDVMNTSMKLLKGLAWMEELEFKKAQEEFLPLWEDFEKVVQTQKPDVAQNYVFTLMITNPDSHEIPKFMQGRYFEPFSNFERADIQRIKAAHSLYIQNDIIRAKAQVEVGKKWIEKLPSPTAQDFEKKLYGFLEEEMEERDLNEITEKLE